MTIEFKERTLINEKKLDKKQSKSFLKFLEEERIRHKLKMNECKAKAEANWRKPVLAIAYQTSAIRHYDDILFTEKTIKYLRDKFSL